MSLENIIENQEKEADILEKLDDELYELTNEYKKCCKKIPLKERVPKIAKQETALVWNWGKMYGDN